MHEGSEKLNIALVGVGRRGLGVRLPVIRLMEDQYNLVAICDLDGDRARQIAAQYGVSAYTRVQDLVANEHIDVASVSTPGGSHHAIGAYLADRGVHLLVETPIAPTLPMADALIEAVERNGVKLEVAEQYCRDPLHMIKRQVIDAGMIGDVVRVYSLFQTGGYHIFSSIRMMMGEKAASRVTAVTMETDVPQVVASDVRQYTREQWRMDVVEFGSGAMAFSAYSPLYHARALGRKSKTLFQVDGTTGTIVEDVVYLTTEAQRLGGGQATAYPIRTITRDVDGIEMLEKMEVESDPRIIWENPWPQYRTSPAGLAVVEEMDSIAQAVLHDRPTRYDGRRARQDIEIQIAGQESGQQGWTPMDLPLKTITAYEGEVHEQFERDYGCDPFDLERAVDVFYPKQ